MEYGSTLAQCWCLLSFYLRQLVYLCVCICLAGCHSLFVPLFCPVHQDLCLFSRMSFIVQRCLSVTAPICLEVIPAGGVDKVQLLAFSCYVCNSFFLCIPLPILGCLPFSFIYWPVHWLSLCLCLYLFYSSVWSEHVPVCHFQIVKGGQRHANRTKRCSDTFIHTKGAESSKAHRQI